MQTIQHGGMGKNPSGKQLADIAKIVQRTAAPLKSEDGPSREVKRPEFTPSRSYKFIRQQSEICAGLSRIMLA